MNLPRSSHFTATSFRRLGVALLVSLFLAFPGSVTAQEPIAEVQNFGDALVFTPVNEFGRLVLTVTGPCDFRYRQEVTKGDLMFRLDETTIDGVYTYDLVRMERIDPGIIEILQDARKNFDEETPRQLCRDGKLPSAPLSQSEGFMVSEGTIIYDPEAVEKGSRLRTVEGSSLTDGTVAANNGDDLRNMSAADFVVIDDLIIDGSACIGFDCVNGESFGFDTIRLKENNLRIKFDDTSVAASFPRNDWQLTANDSANGGASKFSIDDISGSRTPFTVEANAPSHSLYVDDGGRIGRRTSTPVTEIHVKDGDTPTLRLEQDTSSGFAAQTWDVAGNETSFFIRDATNGSQLPFRIRPGADSNSLVIDADNDVGIGVLSAEAALHVRRTSGDTQLLVEEASGTEASRVLLDLTNNGQVRYVLRDESADGEDWEVSNLNSGFNISLIGSGGPEIVVTERDLSGATDVMTVAGDIAAVDFNMTSSRELKTALAGLDVQEILNRLVGLDLFEWSFKSDPVGIRHVGPMAEDFLQAFNLGTDSKHISLVDSNGIALAAIQALQQQNEELKERLARLEQLLSQVASSD